ncbi:unnamed protein product, partial [Allacma fusca]
LRFQTLKSKILVPKNRNPNTLNQLFLVTEIHSFENWTNISRFKHLLVLLGIITFSLSSKEFVIETLLVLIMKFFVVLSVLLAAVNCQYGGNPVGMGNPSGLGGYPNPNIPNQNMGAYGNPNGQNIGGYGNPNGLPQNTGVNPNIPYNPNGPGQNVVYNPNGMGQNTGYGNPGGLNPNMNYNPNVPGQNVGYGQQGPIQQGMGGNAYGVPANGQGVANNIPQNPLVGQGYLANQKPVSGVPAIPNYGQNQGFPAPVIVLVFHIIFLTYVFKVTIL